MRRWEQFMAFLREHPGATTPEIAEAIGESTGHTYVIGKKLVPYRMVRMEVEEKAKAGSVTRWWPRGSE